MKFILNCSPHLTMSEITKLLFNCKFLSDIQFIVGDKIIYAHSLELMKRSTVFQQQLQDICGEQKLIPIVDCSYKSFLEFIRYIYTDDCTINESNKIELLKLAIKYKVIMLENKVLNTMYTTIESVKLFEHCVVDNYKMARNISSLKFAFNFSRFIKCEYFLLLHPEALNEILQFKRIEKNVSEVQLFNRLASWINHYCEQNQMSLSDGRQRFDHLIRKIRFPLMTMTEIQECDKQYPGLLNKHDLISIQGQILFKENNPFDLWISVPRQKYRKQLIQNTIQSGDVFSTSLTVVRDIILHGLWIGVSRRELTIEIAIEERDIKTNEFEKLVFTQATPECKRLGISLGDSIRLKPDFVYTITTKYLDDANPANIPIYCRNLIFVTYNDPENAIQTINPSFNILEIIFKLPEC